MPNGEKENAAATGLGDRLGGRFDLEEVVMATPSPAGPPRLRMMSSLDLDEHPSHGVRDHLLALGVMVLFCTVAFVLSL